MLTSSQTNNKSSQIIYIENLIPGFGVEQVLEKNGFIVDIALGADVLIEGVQLKRGHWSVSGFASGKRRIELGRTGIGSLLSFWLHENPHNISGINGIKKGVFTSNMIFPVLKMIVILEKGAGDRFMNHRIDCYKRLLVEEISRNLPAKRVIAVSDFKKVVEMFDRLETSTDRLPVVSELTDASGLSASGFQRICKILYGESVQKMLQKIKMNHAFRSLKDDHMDIAEISIKSGYRHSNNFITAFHTHFGIPPKDMELLEEGC